MIPVSTSRSSLAASTFLAIPRLRWKSSNRVRP
jgi:hypothetical protein